MNLCPAIPTLTLNQFGEQARGGTPLTHRRIPYYGTMEVTHRCNLNCVHCYLPRKKTRKKELTLPQYRSLLKHLAERDCLFMLLTGGEPLCRKDTAKIYLEAKRRGFLVAVFTNATLLDRSFTGMLRDNPPHIVEISLYGATERTYESVTRVKGSFKACMNGLAMLQKKKIFFKLKTVLMTLNKHEFPAMQRLAGQLGTTIAYDYMITPRLDLDKEPLRYRLSPEEIVEFEAKDTKRFSSIKKFVRKFSDLPRTDNLYSCAAGWRSFVVNPYGELNMCITARSPRFNILKHGFDKGFFGSFPREYFKKVKKGFVCKDCSSIAICGACPEVAYLENGDPETPVQFLCDITKLREKKLAA